MITTQLPRDLKDQILDGIAQKPNGPFEKSFGSTYLKFDGIVLNKEKLSFTLNRKEVFFFDLSELNRGETLTLSQIEGRIPFLLSGV